MNVIISANYKRSLFRNILIHAEVVTRVAYSLEAGGLPGYPESLFVEMNKAVKHFS